MHHLKEAAREIATLLTNSMVSHRNLSQLAVRYSCSEPTRLIDEYMTSKFKCNQVADE